MDKIFHTFDRKICLNYSYIGLLSAYIPGEHLIYIAKIACKEHVNKHPLFQIVGVNIIDNGSFKQIVHIFDMVVKIPAQILYDINIIISLFKYLKSKIFYHIGIKLCPIDY